MSDERRQWFFVRNGQAFGPLPFHALREAVYAGMLSADDEVWDNSGFRDQASAVEGLPFDRPGNQSATDAQPRWRPDGPAPPMGQEPPPVAGPDRPVPSKPKVVAPFSGSQIRARPKSGLVPTVGQGKPTRAPKSPPAGPEAAAPAPVPDHPVSAAQTKIAPPKTEEPEQAGAVSSDAPDDTLPTTHASGTSLQELCFPRRSLGGTLRVAGAVVVAVALVAVARSYWWDPTGNARTMRTAAAVVGAALAVERSDTNVLLITEPPGWSGHSSRLERCLKRGLSDGLGSRGRVVAVAYPGFPEGLREAMRQKTGRDMKDWYPPVHEWYTFSMVKDMLSRHPRTDVVVSAVGMPRDCDALLTDNWQPTTSPVFAIIAGPLPRKEFLRNAMSKGIIAVAVASQPVNVNTVPSTVPADLSTRFAERFCLVTSDTFDTVVRKLPGSFGNFPEELPPPPQR